MAMFSKIPLSASTNGKGFFVAAVATLIHTAGAATTNILVIHGYVNRVTV